MNRRRFLQCAATGLFVPSAMALPPIQNRRYSNKSGIEYIIREDCESGVTPTGWTNTGAVTWNHTPSISENYSLQIDASTALAGTQVSIPPIYDLYVYFMFNGITIPSTNVRSFLYLKNGSNQLLVINQLADETFAITPLGGSQRQTYIAYTVGTTYHMWIHYRASNGSNNGFASIEFNTTGIESQSGTDYRESTDGTSTLPVLLFNPYFTFGTDGNTVMFDKIRLSKTRIGSNPA